MAATFRSVVHTIKRHTVEPNDGVIYYGPLDVCPVIKVKSRGEALLFVKNENLQEFSPQSNPDRYRGQTYIHPLKGLIRLIIDDETESGANPLNQSHGPNPIVTVPDVPSKFDVSKKFKQGLVDEKSVVLVRVVLVSDTHELHDYIKMPEGPVDMLIHCGDILQADSFTPLNKFSTQKMESFMKWFNCQCPTYGSDVSTAASTTTQMKDLTTRIILSGNHDLILSKLSLARIREIAFPSIYLEDDVVSFHPPTSCVAQNVVEASGLSIFGSPRSYKGSHHSPNKAFQCPVLWTPHTHTISHREYLFFKRFCHEGVFGLSDILNNHDSNIFVDPVHLEQDEHFQKAKGQNVKQGISQSVALRLAELRGLADCRYAARVTSKNNPPFPSEDAFWKLASKGPGAVFPSKKSGCGSDATLDAGDVCFSAVDFFSANRRYQSNESHTLRHYSPGAQVDFALTHQSGSSKLQEFIEGTVRPNLLHAGGHIHQLKGIHGFYNVGQSAATYIPSVGAAMTNGTFGREYIQPPVVIDMLVARRFE